jgi:hypothetical protein
VVQLLNGTCGAPVDTSASTKDASWHVHNQAGVYYFSVVDIHNALLIVTTYAYDANTATFSVIDSFSIFKGGQTGPNLLLLGNGRDLPRKEEFSSPHKINWGTGFIALPGGLRPPKEEL